MAIPSTDPFELDGGNRQSVVGPRSLQSPSRTSYTVVPRPAVS